MYRPFPSCQTFHSKLLFSYIHGGAWRDPRKTKSGILPSLSHLFPSSSNPAQATRHIAAIASLNYRLSPHPSFPPDSGDEDDAVARSARHPDHVNDVIDALRWLARTWGVRDGGYVFVGHSCGGTLALQVAMSGGRKWGDEGEKQEGEKTPVPRAVVPVEAITDIPALVTYHSEQAMYKEFVVAAFGGETEVWKAASPTSGRYGVEKGWKEAKLVIMAHSREDELVEWEQCDLMLETLRKQGWEESSVDGGADENPGKQREVMVLELKGKHDEVWEKGGELAKAIETAVEKVARMDLVNI